VKLELGKTYITAGGGEATVVRVEGSGDFDDYHVEHDEDVRIWHFSDGRANIGGKYDLVSETSAPTPTHPDPDRYIRILEAMLTDEQVKTANRIMGVM